MGGDGLGEIPAVAAAEGNDDGDAHPANRCKYASIAPGEPIERECHATERIADEGIDAGLVEDEFGAKRTTASRPRSRASR